MSCSVPILDVLLYQYRYHLFTIYGVSHLSSYILKRLSYNFTKFAYKYKIFLNNLCKLTYFNKYKNHTILFFCV